MSVTWQTAGAFDTGTSSCAPGLPASTAAGNLLVIGCTFGNGNDTPLDTPAGWTLIPDSLEFGGDGGAYGTDSGNRGVMAFLRIADGTEGATVTVTNPGSGTTTRVTSAQIMRFTKTGDAWNVKASNGEDNTDAAGYSVTADSVLIPANGDQGIAVTGWNPDSATAGTPTLTWDGVATTCTQAQSIASTQGADVRFLIYRRNLAGTGGSAPVFATTASAAVTGATAFLLIHDGPAVTGQAVGSFGFTATAAGVVSDPPVSGQATAAFGFTATTSGLPRTSGEAVAAFGFTATAAGVPEVFGVAIASLGFTGTASGAPRKLGVAVVAFGFTATASGTPRHVGAALASFGFDAQAAGVVGNEPVLGQAAAAFGFTAQAAGIDRALGVASGSFGFAGAANGVAQVLGQAITTLGFIADAVGIATRPTPTPAERTSVAPASTRRSVAALEARAAISAAVDRTSSAAATSRTST